MINSKAIYNCYKTFKNSGVDWIGDIPESWHIKRLRYTARINMGQAPNSELVNKDGFGIPFLQGNAEFQDLCPIEQNWCISHSKKCNPEDILISVRAPVGELNIADKCYAIGRGLAAITSIEYEKELLYYILLTAKKELQSISTGSTFSAINYDDLANMLLPLPPCIEQQAICSFLDKETTRINTIILKERHLIELLKEKRAALITSAVTKGLDPNVKMKPSGVEWIGDIPENWNIKHLKRGLDYLTDFEANGSFADLKNFVTIISTKDYAWYVRATDLENNRSNDQEGNHFCDEGTYKFLKKTSLYGGELLVVKRGEIGKVYLLPKLTMAATLAPNLYLLRFHSKYLVQNYVFWYFQSIVGQQELINANNSTTIGALYKDDIKYCLCIYPSIEEQIQIAVYLQKITLQINHTIDKIILKISLLEEYKQSLITAAVTGKINVRNHGTENS